MITAISFGVAAALGGLARAESGRRWNRHRGFPTGTLMVNVAGSFLLGVLHDAGPAVATVAGVGGLGAFTTFSSFARDAAALVELRRFLMASGYVVASCGLGVLAAALGIALS